jgi:hypothetical protein
LPEFDLTIRTVRSGTHVVRIVADDEIAALEVATAEGERAQCHCPSEWCTDDVESTVLHVRQVVLEDVTIIAVDGVGLGTLCADDSLRRTRQLHA